MVCSFTGNRDGVDGDPEAFDITADRGDAKPLTFGAGIHYCLGANLARAELQEALAFLPARMPGLALDGEAELGSIHGIYGLDRLPLSMELGLAHFLTDYGMQPTELGPHGRGARLRVAASRRAHAHPGQPRDAVPGRRRAAAASTATRSTRSWRSPRSRRSRERHQDRHRRLPRDPARPDRDREGGRDARPRSRAGASCSASAPAGTVEEMRNHGTDPKTRFRRHARAHRGDEGDLDGGRGRVPRRASSTSTRSGAGRSRCRSRTRRCSRRRRARRCSTAWSPTATSGSRTASRHPEELGARIAELQRRAEAAGRGRIPVTVFGAKPERPLARAPEGSRRRRARCSTSGPASPARSSATSTSSPRWRRSGTPRRARPVAVAVEVRVQGAARGRADAAVRAPPRAGRQAARLRGQARAGARGRVRGLGRVRQGRRAEAAGGAARPAPRARRPVRGADRATRSATTSCGASGPRSPGSAG